MPFRPPPLFAISISRLPSLPPSPWQPSGSNERAFVDGGGASVWFSGQHLVSGDMAATSGFQNTLFPERQSKPVSPVLLPRFFGDWSGGSPEGCSGLFRWRRAVGGGLAWFSGSLDSGGVGRLSGEQQIGGWWFSPAVPPAAYSLHGSKDRRRHVTSHGINAGDVKKLQDAGIYTCNGLMMHTKKNLTGIKGLAEAKVDKICEATGKIVNFGYITGSDALLKRKSVVHVTTGSQALDELLGGGIETSAITEAFREFRSGKTQLAHTLCVSTQLPTSMKGGNGKVAYIGTEGTFRPDRILPIAERFGMDAGAVLDNIIYARAYTYEHQYNLLLGLAAKMAEEPFRLLIVDSVIALFRVDFTGRGELAERQQKLAQMLSRLTKIAEEFNVAVYMTNQVIADLGGGVFISDPKKPAGGHVLAHAATIRLMFRKGKGEQRVCKVFDAPNLPESEAISFHC
ncbi:PREDICTED: meiotic recombination protein DMC1 homolog [Ipomoea nil]|uniref:meiotic recombination protein DMC1 homolog n=1 Tax=Ipomoea nil TaxID=35883 RepID=UPI0009012696|nr:PREDICTED: meiotic recombination protein DMC1 homolog [Ipomoea nil]